MLIADGKVVHKVLGSESKDEEWGPLIIHAHAAAGDGWKAD